ncbi:MAG: MATE family efflux transporter [bacterium]|jgi:MATE family multidrug resistance protein|nr:MATE family efflux transporter [bacterium]MBK9775921.1 MATE family efflux transporter [bacterium]
MNPDSNAAMTRGRPTAASLLRVHDGREIMALALPNILTMLSQTMMWTVDTALLGRVDSASLAAAGLGGMITWCGYSLFNNLSRISGTFVAQAHGGGDDELVGHYAWQGLYIALLTGVLLSFAGWYSYLVLPWTRNPAEVQALTYTYIQWRSVSAVATQVSFAVTGFFAGRRDVRVPMWCGLLGNLVNVVLDIWLIFGWSGFTLGGITWLAVPAMGIKGASIATSIGTFVNAAALVGFALAPSLRARYRIHRARRPDRHALARLVRVGSPAAGENFVDMGGFVMFSIFVGTAGAVPLAASQITIQLLSFSFMPLWGLTMAAGVLTGNCLGAGNVGRAAHYGRQVYKLGAYYSLLLAVIMVALRDHIFGVFTNDPLILALGPSLAVAAAVFQYFDGVRMVSSGILQGAGDTRYAMIVTAILMWGMFIPLTWYLVVASGGNVITAWMGASLCYLLQGWFLWRRFASGKWQHARIFG